MMKKYVIIVLILAAAIGGYLLYSHHEDNVSVKQTEKKMRKPAPKDENFDEDFSELEEPEVVSRPKYDSTAPSVMKKKASEPGTYTNRDIKELDAPYKTKKFIKTTDLERYRDARTNQSRKGFFDKKQKKFKAENGNNDWLEMGKEKKDLGKQKKNAGFPVKNEEDDGQEENEE